jgi:DNA-binding transcriptional regulator GbsR (MarR family)
MLVEESEFIAERKAMVQEFPVELATSEYKEVEEQIADFYIKIAEKGQINLKLSKIFAYFKIYDSLTQKQIKELTGFSTGFISTALKSFLHSTIVTRNFIPKTHTKIYTINNEHVFTIVTPREQVNRNNAEHEKFIIKLQTKLEKLKGKYPLESKFLFRRLNGIRNYLETQKRAHTELAKSVYLIEDVSNLIPPDKFIDYPPEIEELESSLVDRFVRMNMFIEDDPIINKILTFLITREKMSQEMLLELTGYSRSTISRNLKGYGEQDYVAISKKEYLKPRIYYMDSIGIYLNEIILMNRRFLISWRPIFVDLLKQLESSTIYKKNKEMNIFKQRKITDLITKIDLVIKRVKLLENAQQELKEFVLNK